MYIHIHTNTHFCVYTEQPKEPLPGFAPKHLLSTYCVQSLQDTSRRWGHIVGRAEAISWAWWKVEGEEMGECSGEVSPSLGLYQLLLVPRLGWFPGTACSHPLHPGLTLQRLI